MFGGEIIRQRISGYLKNITDNNCEQINENAILKKEQLSYFQNNVKHTILFKEKEIFLTRESNEFKNVLTFSKNRSILSKYIIKENNVCVYIEVKTLELKYNNKELYIKYKIIDSDTIYEYKIILED